MKAVRCFYLSVLVGLFTYFDNFDRVEVVNFYKKSPFLPFFRSIKEKFL